ncbi:hypothetical protein SUGI_0749290 [Cryptomeria japonica]|uniref:RNA polymerase sigma factor sigE, chloroplastic/mitochondrial n=1 Tax=Cryptomeria japonica TaxID=3369 RepID=UPI002414CE5B|nr:RNA polymerase sigma factor sigE, chloroplastic/mitochondrial [Cryptomeria japonica]GLJ36992.1 hypothetical protein SUGI_0749290 [Cryptomeria japonica]
MGGVTISTAGNQAQFGITAVKTGILSDRLASSGRSFSLHHTLYRNLCNQKTGLIAKAEHRGQKFQSSPIFTVSNCICTIENQERLSSKTQDGKKKTRTSSRVKNATLNKGSTCTIPSADIDYGKAAVTLEHIYNDSPSVSDSNFETSDKIGKTKSKRRKTKSLNSSAANYKESRAFLSDSNIETVDKIGKSKAKRSKTKSLDLSADNNNESQASVSGLNFETSDRIRKAGTKRKRTKGLILNAGNYETSPISSVTDAISNSIKPNKVGMVPATKPKFKSTFNNETACSARSTKERKKRLSLGLRIASTKAKLDRMLGKDQTASQRNKKVNITNGDPDFWCEEVDALIKSYSISPMHLNWNRLQVRELLSPSEHIWLAKLMKPMKFYIQTKGSLKKVFRREPREQEIAAALKIPLRTFKRHIEAGRAARNKLIQHNLRLVLFEIYKYNINGSRLGFEDACLEGTKGLMIGVDRFEPEKGFRLSTYAMYWIRHAILRAMTLSNIVHIPFVISGLKLERQRTILDLLLKLGRAPTAEEIRAQMGLDRERYNDVVRACKKSLSYDDCDRDNSVPYQHNESYSTIKPQALLRLGLDDVLDSLKPKESLVIRQRFGLDGRGKRSLGEIARNLNISREMVRKHEVKAMLKLKHPSRVEYIRGYL